MHLHIWGIHRANVDDDDFSSFQRKRWRWTDTQRQGLVHVDFFQSLLDFGNKEET